MAPIGTELDDFVSRLSGLIIAEMLKPCLVPSPGLRPPSPGGRGDIISLLHQGEGALQGRMRGAFD
jgi:hypothetical protein